MVPRDEKMSGFGTERNAPLKTNRYVIIAGRGRSGTNWLLSILDRSARTHCRNEPSAMPGSALHSMLPPGTVAGIDDAALASHWDEAIRRTARCFGERDHAVPVLKDHFFPVSQRLGLVRIASSPRLQRSIAPLLPSSRKAEWPIPVWVASRRKLDEAVPVLKLNQVPGWASWALRHRPEAFILHIVRHPGGFLNSWANRWLNRNEAERVAEANRRRLETVVQFDPSWRDRFGPIDRLDVAESELWYWRYTTETIHKAGQERPSSYRLAIYEDLVHDPVGVARSLYDALELPWTEAIEIATAWRSKLTADRVAMVERVLEGSLTQDWWSEPDQASVEQLT